MLRIRQGGAGVEHLLVLDLWLRLTEEGERIATVQDVGSVGKCGSVQGAIDRHGGSYSKRSALSADVWIRRTFRDIPTNLNVKEAPCVSVLLVVRLYSLGDPFARQPGEYWIWASALSMITLLELMLLGTLSLHRAREGAEVGEGEFCFP